jgi:hypothetical protein
MGEIPGWQSGFIEVKKDGSKHKTMDESQAAARVGLSE